jgi:hypothetical protein
VEISIRRIAGNEMSAFLANCDLDQTGIARSPDLRRVEALFSHALH